MSSADVVQVCEILSGENVIKPDPDVQQPFVQQLRSPLTLDELCALQSQDNKCTTLIRMLKNGKLDPVAYSLQEGVLYRRVVEGGQSFQAIYVPRTPESLIQAILQAAHDESGHNGFPRTYSAIRRLYYWKGIKEDVLQHCRNCYTCQLHKTAAVKFEAKHFKPSLKPMDFIAMDLIGEFHPPSSQGNRYALTGVCMLTGFTWCIPIMSKKATDVARAYMQHVYSILGGSTKILTDNGTEFKNEVFREVLQKLGTEKLIHSPPYRPQSNGRIEGFHRYLKACIAKHMRNGLEWDQITAMATAAYNYFPNMSAKESAFFLMYGRDPVNKLSSILNAPRRYLCDDSGLPDLGALKNMYQMVAQQLYNSRQRYIKDNKYNKVPDHGILVGDLVLVKDHTAKNLIPPGLIPYLGWNTDQQGPNRQPLPTEKQPEVAATQITPTQVEGPPSSRLRSKTSKNNLPYEQDQQDPPERNRTTVDLPSVTYEVNQLQIIGTTHNRMQVVLPVMLIVILLLINVFFYFRL